LDNGIAARVSVLARRIWQRELSFRNPLVSGFVAATGEQGAAPTGNSLSRQRFRITEVETMIAGVLGRTAPL
jgi:hypothetical protein